MSSNNVNYPLMTAGTGSYVGWSQTSTPTVVTAAQTASTWVSLLTTSYTPVLADSTIIVLCCAPIGTSYSTNGTLGAYFKLTNTTTGLDLSITTGATPNAGQYISMYGQSQNTTNLVSLMGSCGNGGNTSLSPINFSMSGYSTTTFPDWFVGANGVDSNSATTYRTCANFIILETA